MPDCNVCAVGNSYRLAHAKRTDHRVKHPFQLVLTDLIGPIFPEAIISYKYVRKPLTRHTKQTATNLLKSKATLSACFNRLPNMSWFLAAPASGA